MQRKERREIRPALGVWRAAAALVCLPGAAAAVDEAGTGPAPLAELAEPLRQLLPSVFFEYQLLGIELWQWLGLLVLVFATALLSWIAAHGALRALRPLAARTDTAIDDELLASADAPLRLAIAIALLRIGIVPLSLAPEALDAIGKLLSALLVVSVAWLLTRATDVLAHQVEAALTEQEGPEAIALVPPGRKAAKAAIVLLAVVATLDSFGFSVTTLVAGLGVGGIAVALAAQKTVENLFGGFTLYADRPIQVGDFGRFGNLVGTVEEIGLRSTRIRTLDRTLVSIPNGEFSAMHIETFAARDRIRFFSMIGLRYETTPDQLRHVLVEIRRLLYSHERLTNDPARIRFVGYGAYSLDLELFAYADTADWNEFLGIREDLLLRIMDIVADSGTGFAFPSQTLYLGKDDGLSEEQGRRVTETIDQWRRRSELYLPDFPAEKIAELENTVRFPPEGSPARTP
jgi:MscS family membrane protein